MAAWHFFDRDQFFAPARHAALCELTDLFAVITEMGTLAKHGREALRGQSDQLLAKLFAAPCQRNLLPQRCAQRLLLLLMTRLFCLYSPHAQETASMAGSHDKIVRITTAHAGFTKLLVATIRLADGRTITREIEDHGSAVCVLPYNVNRKAAVLVRQLRAPVLYAEGHRDTLEAIAGIIEESDPVVCARREAMEEAGLHLDQIELVAQGWTMPGVSTERMHFFLARYPDQIVNNDRRGVESEHEDVFPVEIELARLASMADERQITDVKTLLLVQSMRLLKPELFRAP
jgi:nudix-type nucleoside diphosphatase (YffH/AdpP family)